MRPRIAVPALVIALVLVAASAAWAAGAFTARLSPPVVTESFTALPCTGKPNARTTLQQEGCAEQQILRSDRTINSLAKSIFSRLADDPARRRFIAAQRSWVSYRRADCLSRSDEFEGGSQAPVISAQCAAAIDNQRIKDLRSFLRGLGTGAAASTAAVPFTTRNLTPVVLFPAFHFTKLQVRVHDQTAAPGCPKSGSFQDWFGSPHPYRRFSQVCRDELLTLRYDADPRLAMPRRFSEQHGVRVTILDYGKTASAPFYAPLYKALEAAGYTADRNIRVAGYDARLTPDLGGFLPRTVALIEATYRANGDRPVQLVAHSNGPLYAQYLLTHTSLAWRDKYIHGFTPIAGNFPGQGSVYSIMLTGLNTQDFSYPKTRANALSSARMFLSSPASYMSSGDPAVFGHREVVLQDAATHVKYTPADYRRLFTDEHLPDALQIAKYYIGFVKFRDRADFPDVDVSAERGSGIPTVVGAVLPNLSVGQVVTKKTVLINQDGDVNQEDTTNTAIRVWKSMGCHRFSLTDNPGVDHFSLPSNPKVLNRLIAELARPRSSCAA